MVSFEDDANGSVGYDFEDDQTRLQLALIDDLQKLGVSKYLDLPLLVVVGDQSTGKSSVLRAVTEIPFPIKDNLCTRFATEIVLERTPPDKPTQTKVEIIPDSNESTERQSFLSAWRPSRFQETDSLNEARIKEVFGEAEEAICGNTVAEDIMTRGRTTNPLSKSTLRITRKGPRETNFAIVDIPGLVRGEGTRATAKSLVEQYLSNLRSIIVVVIDIVDLERQEIFQILNNLPDEESRVIGVINKCDTKQEKSNDWVFEFIRNEQAKSRRYLKAGWYGLRNRRASEQEISNLERDKLEEEFFAGNDWASLDKDKLGRHNLKKALIKMRNGHIKRSIPSLLSEIQIKLDACIAGSSKYGEERTTNQAQFTLINRIAVKYSKMAEDAIDGHYKNLSGQETYGRKYIQEDLDAFHEAMKAGGCQHPFRNSKEDAEVISASNENEWGVKIMAIPTYDWIYRAIKCYRGTEQAGDVNPEVKDALWRDQTVSWKKIATEALEIVEKTVADFNTALFKVACPDETLRFKLRNWLQDDVTKALEDARNELQILLADEVDSHLFTLNPALSDRQEKRRESRIQAVIELVRQDLPVLGLQQVAQPPLAVNPVAPEVIVRSLMYRNTVAAGILETHDSLAAYYEFAVYRFIDNFALQVVERHLLGPRGPLRLFTSDYVSQRLYGEHHAMELNDLASEDPTRARERVKLQKERASLEQSKKLVLSFKIL